jgi:hypothetical protein
MDLKWRVMHPMLLPPNFLKLSGAIASRLAGTMSCETGSWDINKSRAI